MVGEIRSNRFLTAHGYRGINIRSLCDLIFQTKLRVKEIVVMRLIEYQPIVVIAFHGIVKPYGIEGLRTKTVDP